MTYDSQTADMPSLPTISLNDGRAIPQLGFGVFQIAPEVTASAISQALEVGYRHIDTSEMYEGEAGRFGPNPDVFASVPA
jgi:2,5-diketo-D-gluconate reductase A